MFGRKKPFGFTVIELLIVMAIIMILAGILVPAMAAARRHALNVKCAGHMRTWGQTLARYTTSHKGELPPIVADSDSLYAAGPLLKQYFVDENLPPDTAYCPYNGEVYADRGVDDWGSVEFEAMAADFSPANALVLVDNIPDNTAADISIPDVLVDNSDTSGPDNYYAVSGPATPVTKVFPSGFHGTNYDEIACVDPSAGGGTTEIIVDNLDTSGPNRLTFSAASDHAVSTGMPGYHATNYQWVRPNAPPAGAELIVIDNDTAGTDNYFAYTGSASHGTSTNATPGSWQGANYEWIIGTDAATTGTATWHFKVPDSGMVGQSVNLAIQTQWPTWPEKGMDGITYTVNYEGGSQDVVVNQINVGGQWNSLGVFTFKYGSSYSVSMSNSTPEYNKPVAGQNRFAFADAVRVLTVGDGPLVATWHFTVADPGGLFGQSVNATIDGWWPLAPTKAVEDVRFVIYHDGGSTTQIVNQRTIGSAWHNFGVFPVLYGTSYKVEMHSGSLMIGQPTADNKWMFADAVRVTVDGGGEDPSTATWNFKIPTPAGRSAGDSVNLKVEAKWPGSATDCIKDATFTITHAGGTTDVTVDQQDAGTGGTWQTLGNFNFACDGTYSVQLSNTTSLLADPAASNINIHADAIRVTDPSSGGDNVPASGFAVLTDGWNGSSTNATAYGTGSPKYQYVKRPGDAGPQAAVWVFTAPAGLHTVYGWWPTNTTHGTGVPFTIHERISGTQIASASMSQQDGGEWIPIATCDFVGGDDYYVKMTNNATGGGNYVIADAIAIPKTDTGGSTANAVFGYLYLGDRGALPEPPDGAAVPSTPVQLVGNTKANDNPSGTPILVDWMSDTPKFSSHGDFGHVLMLDISVQSISFDDSQHRWTDEYGTKFYW